MTLNKSPGAAPMWCTLCDYPAQHEDQTSRTGVTHHVHQHRIHAPKSPVLHFCSQGCQQQRGPRMQEGSISPGDGTSPHPGEHFHFVSVVLEEGCCYCCPFLCPCQPPMPGTDQIWFTHPTHTHTCQKLRQLEQTFLYLQWTLGCPQHLRNW